MNGWFRRLGIDYGQWKALARAAIRNDLRGSSIGGARSGGPTRGLRFLVVQTGFYTAMGILIAILVWPIRDLFLSGTIVVSYVMFMVGTAVLLDHNAVIVSPDDYGILGFRPVDSRTYFAARLTNVLIYTTAMTTTFCLVPMVGVILRWGPAVGVAAIAAVYGASVLTALVMIVVYAALLRTIGPMRLRTGLSYLQLLFSFAVYGGYFLMAQFADADSRAAYHLTKTPGLLLTPPTWFASYLELAAGRTTAMVIVPAAASIAALGILVVSLRGRLSLEYAERLGALTALKDLRRAAPRPRVTLPFFSTGEARAVALLVGSQFRNDMKFRMGVLAILPLTVVYLIIGIRQWGGLDPFRTGEIAHNLSLITIAMLIFPTLLKINLTRSDSYRASWIFFATPADRTRLVRSAKDILTVMFLLPYLLVVGLVLTYFTGNGAYVLVYLVVMGMVSHLLLQIATLIEPELPFSKPIQKGSAASRVVFLMVSVGGASAVFPLVGPLMVGSVLVSAVVVGLLVLASLGVDYWMRRRIVGQAARLEFVER